jgi:hypothetical protein
MNVKSYTKGRTVKTVVLENVGNESKDEIREMAYRAAGETRESTFGTHVYEPPMDPTIVRVDIYTD